MITLKERCLNEEYGFARSNFIDDFRITPDIKIIQDSILDVKCLNIIQKSILAATVDQLCYEMNVDRPDWIFDKSTYLKEPYFALNAKGNFRIILLQESPSWYRSRNLFVTKNCSERV